MLIKTGKFLFGVAFVLLFCSNSLLAKDVEVKFTPQRLVAGEQAYLDVIYNGRLKPTIDKLPNIGGFVWGKGFKRREQKSSKGYHQEVIRYSFVAERSGRITFPSLVVSVGGDELRTQKLFLNVHAAAKTLDLGKYIFAKVREPNSNVVIGQKLPVIVDVYYRAGLDVKSLKSNSVKVKNCVVLQAEGRASDMSLLDDKGRVEVELDGVPFEKYSFITSMQAVGVGLAEAQFSFKASVTVPVKRGGGDLAIDERSFTGYKDPFARYERIEYSTKPVNCKFGVTALPAEAKERGFIGLVGEWKIDVRLVAGLSSSSGSSGSSPVTLVLSAAGEGVVADFRPPVLELSGVRVFEPELRYSGDGVNDSRVEATYILIPLSKEDVPIQLKGAHYSVKQKKFIDFEFNSIIKGNLSLVQPEESTTASAKPEEILPLQTDYSYKVNLPLRRNMYNKLVLLGILTVALVAWILYRRQKEMVGADGGVYRRMRAFKQRKILIKRIKRAEDDEIALVLNTDIRQNLCDFYTLPPSSSASDLKPHIDNELVEILIESEKAVYMTDLVGSAGRFDRKRITKLIKGCLSVAFVMVVSIASASGKYQSAIDVYTDGDFDTALAEFSSMLESDEVSPALLYNIANSHFKKGDFVNAFVCYERVLRLDPRNGDARENLRVVRQKLLLDDKPSRFATLESFRDCMRPDEWIAIAFISLVSVMLLGCSRFSRICIEKRRRAPHSKANVVRRSCGYADFSESNKSVEYGFLNQLVMATLNSISAPLQLIALGTCAVLLISCVAFWSQVNSSYDSRLNVVIKKNMLRNLPSDHSELSYNKLIPGDDVIVLKNNGVWSFVRHGEADGWIRSSSIVPIVPEL